MNGYYCSEMYNTKQWELYSIERNTTRTESKQIFFRFSVLDPKCCKTVLILLKCKLDISWPSQKEPNRQQLILESRQQQMPNCDKFKGYNYKVPNAIWLDIKFDQDCMPINPKKPLLCKPLLIIFKFLLWLCRESNPDLAMNSTLTLPWIQPWPSRHLQ